MKYHVSHYLYRVAALLIGITACVAAESAPHVPDRDTVVLEQLPLKPTDPSTVELRALRRSLAREPDNTALAAHLAQAYIKRGRIESDPRYLGYAQAALAPWWNLPQPPVNVLVLRAVIHQANHRFDAALADLANALQREPRNVQAWLTRASVEQARGDYAAARRSCLSLARQSATLVGYGCLTAVESLNGEAVRSYALLQQVMLRSAPLDGDMRQWLHGLLAEMAARRGDAPAADAHYRQALAAGTPDAY